jgi:hypothetical protein
MLRASGELENTIVIMTSDHGMPFPRAKSNLYDSGTRIPLAIHWPERFKGGFRVTDFVSLIDLAPTFLESAGLAVPEVVSGRSLVPQLTAGKGGRIDPSRDHVLTGKERHVPSQPAPDSGGYPCRAIRTDDYLLIRNFTPDRWPAGTGETDNSFLNGAWYGDCDNGPTKSYMIGNRDAGGAAKQLYDLSFGKRPEYELFDLRKDPAQVDNVATNPGYAGVLKELSAKLDEKLRASGDPRVTGGGETFDAYPYAGSGPRLPGARQRGKGKNKRKP